MYPRKGISDRKIVAGSLPWLIGISIALLFVAAWEPDQASADVQYVINISIDGLGSSYLEALVDANQTPHFERFLTQGRWTYNARNDYDITVTLPNHVTMVTGRGIVGVDGHNWTSNGDPAPTDTIHKNKGSYVASGFDVAHDNGLRTAMYATKTKFILFDQSYNDKLDVYSYNSSSAAMTSNFVAAMKVTPYNYSFLHYTDLDSAGHSSGWGSTNYNNAVKAVDTLLGEVFSLVESTDFLMDKTVILLTADHGGVGTDHSNPANPLDYTIPFGAWGPGVLAGGDLYDMNVGLKLDPGTGRPLYSDALQPIRNGDIANLSLDLLGLGPIPGSTLNADQLFTIPEPSTLVLFGVGAIGVLVCARRRHRNNR